MTKLEPVDGVLHAGLQVIPNWPDHTEADKDRAVIELSRQLGLTIIDLLGGSGRLTLDIELQRNGPAMTIRAIFCDIEPRDPVTITVTVD